MAQNMLAPLHVVKNEDLPPSLRGPEPAPLEIAESVPPEPLPPEEEPRTVDDGSEKPYLRQE